MGSDTDMAFSSRFLPDLRIIWRWHFYAGLFCAPFVLWLSATGIIYLFKPQLEAWLDRPYESLLARGQSAAAPIAQVRAALAAVPGSSLSYYEFPRTQGGAAQVVVAKGTSEFRVYVHPVSAEALHTVDDRERPLRRVFYLHGELLSGDKGSMLIELAGCWTIVLVLTGLVLWWPRQDARFGGVLYPRLHLTGRPFWRDVHAVTGVWGSCFIVALLLTGLPWAKSWGSYFRQARSLAAGASVSLGAWPTGSSSEQEAIAAAHTTHGGSHQHAESPPPRFGRRAQSLPNPDAYAAIDTILPTAAKLGLAYPVQIVPPVRKVGAWFVRSDSQNRMLQDTYTLDPKNGTILRRGGFSDLPLLDRAVSLGISYHEGQLFGVMNQIIGLLTALGAAALSVSGVVMWWRRGPSGVLGAPVWRQAPRFAPALIAFIVALAVVFPMLGISMLFLGLAERLVLRRVPGVRHWLGLRPA